MATTNNVRNALLSLILASAGLGLAGQAPTNFNPEETLDAETAGKILSVLFPTQTNPELDELLTAQLVGDLTKDQKAKMCEFAKKAAEIFKMGCQSFP